MDANVQQILTDIHKPAAGDYSQNVCYPHLELWEWNCHHYIIGALLPCGYVSMCRCALLCGHVCGAMSGSSMEKIAVIQTRQS